MEEYIIMYVQVCGQIGEPIDFSVMGLNVKDGIFQSINEAITAVKILKSCGEKFDRIYRFHLKKHDFEVKMRKGGVFFDEFVQIPKNMNITFKHDVNGEKVVIRAVCLKKGSVIGLMNNKNNIGDPTVNDIQIPTIINGVMKNNDYGYAVFYQETVIPRSEGLESLHRNMNLEVLAAGLTGDFVHNVQDIEPLFDLLKRIKGVTSNFQILLSSFYLADYFNVIKLKIHELDLIISNEDITQHFKQLNDEMYVQELLENIGPAKRKMHRVNRKTLQFLNAWESCLHVSTLGDVMGYRDFLYKFFEIIGENIWVDCQILRRFMEIDIVSDSLYMVKLQQIDDLLNEAQLLVNQASYYVHRVENPTFLLEGENSSEILLNIATTSLQSPDAKIFKEALITFLNEKAHTKIPKGAIIKNDELLAYLRNYTKNCPDADYFFVRFMKNHPNVITGFNLACTGLSTLGTLTSTGITIGKFAMKM